MFKGFWRNVRDSDFAAGFESGAAESLGFDRTVSWETGRRRYKKTGGWLGRKLPGGIRGNKLAFAGNLLSVGYMAYQVMDGYQQGGIWGAMKSGATEMALQGAIRGGFNAIVGAGLGVPTLLAGAAVGAAYGGYKLGEAGQHYAKSLRRLEMGTDIVDTFGTISTMRKRSLDAIQNSHVNGRMALGNEAAMMHRSYRS